MDQTVVELIIDAQKDLRQDLKELNSKVDTILEWKWKLIGGSIVISAVLTFIFQLGLSVYQTKH